ncbi:MAG: uncharacterized protein KVP18_004666 [Porospora cf. gigantea A]|uniref:uncharacterized protein n=1 Tax=Porospora cf. gigantea A TaxID=2853593 RepID=UPI003559AB9E|nr:MAG: hypothetical protein KVP18_004666 [Porospora cf. gigantea A]
MVQLDIRDWQHIHNREGRIAENELQMLMEDNKQLLDTVMASYNIEKELRELLDEAASVNQASQKQMQLITDAVEAMQSHMGSTADTSDLTIGLSAIDRVTECLNVFQNAILQLAAISLLTDSQREERFESVIAVLNSAGAYSTSIQETHDAWLAVYHGAEVEFPGEEEDDIMTFNVH